MLHRSIMLVVCFLSLQSHADSKKHVLILIHSRTGHTLTLAESIKAGLEAKGTLAVEIKRVPPFRSMPKEPENLSLLPTANLDELQFYDALIFGSPVYFHSPAAEIMAFLQAGTEIWQRQLLKDKPAAVFFSSNHNGVVSAQESLRALLEALHMNLGLSAEACANLSNKPVEFGLCLEERLTKKTGPSLTLPPVPEPVGLYKPFVISGNHVYINQIALKNGSIEYPGIIGENVSEEEAKISTRDAMLNILAVLNLAVKGDLSKVKQAVQLSGYFTTVSGYATHARLLDEASKLTFEFLGEQKGRAIQEPHLVYHLFPAILP